MDHRRTDGHDAAHGGHGHGQGVVPAGHDEVDRDINVRGVVWAVGGLLVLAVVVHLLIWYLLVGFDRLEERRDPAPLPLPAASQPRIPPEPRLQPTPEHALIPEQYLLEMRLEEDRVLGNPAWVDQGQGTLRIPIEAAIDVLAERGLPETPAATGGTAGGTTGGNR